MVVSQGGPPSFPRSKLRRLEVNHPACAPCTSETADTTSESMSCEDVPEVEPNADGTGDVRSLSNRMWDLGLRYFTPREVANMHQFPAEFEFPDDITLRQKYSLLGNSLSVTVVADLLRYLLYSDPCTNE